MPSQFRLQLRHLRQLRQLRQLFSQKFLSKAVWIKCRAEQLVLQVANVKTFYVVG